MLREGDVRIARARRLREEELPVRGRSLSKKALWDIYFELNQFKVFVNGLRCEFGATRWEREWWRFVKEAWTKESEAEVWDMPDLVYDFTAPHTKAEYIGETKMGLKKRVIAHLRKAIGGRGRQRLHKLLGVVGVHRGVWTPVYAFRQRGGQPVTRRRRMGVEGRMIWERGSRLNQVGTERAEDKQTSTGLVVFGRRRRQRLVMRLVKKERGPVVCNIEENSAAERQKLEKRKRGRFLALVVRLARRPWRADGKDGINFWNLKTVRAVRYMPRNEFKLLVRMVYGTLDGASRAIALTNLERILRRRQDVVMLPVVVKTPLAAGRRLKKEVEKAVRRWCQEWEAKEKVLVIAKVTVVATATRSVMGLLGSTNAWARKTPSELE